MKPIDQYSNIIQALCAKHRVRKLYAFGSVLTENFSKESDIDLSVDFEPLQPGQYADNYFSLKFALEDTLLRPVDLLEEKALKNPYFMEAIQNQGRLLYTS